jgi:hypothetical protein
MSAACIAAFCVANGLKQQGHSATGKPSLRGMISHVFSQVRMTFSPSLRNEFVQRSAISDPLQQFDDCILHVDFSVSAPPVHRALLTHSTVYVPLHARFLLCLDDHVLQINRQQVVAHVTSPF